MSRRILPLLLVALAALLVGLILWPGAGGAYWPVELGGRGKPQPAPIAVSEAEPVVPETEPVVSEPPPPVAPLPKPERSWTLEIALTPAPAPDEVLAISVLPCEPGIEPDPLALSKSAQLRDGKWVVDVTSYFKPPQKPTSLLRVEVRRPGYLAKVTFAKVAELDWTREGEQGHKQATAAHRVLLHRAKSVRGTATDEKGRPIAGARVWLLPANKRRKKFEAFDQVFTNPEGEFALEVPFDGEWLAVVLQDDFQPATVRMPEVGQNPVVDVKLLRGENLDVQVKIGGEPVQGMAVAVWNRGRSPSREGHSEAWLGLDSVCWEGDQVQRLAVKAPTDEEGRVHFTGLDQSLFTVVTGRYSDSPTVGYSFKGQGTARRVQLPVESAPVFDFTAAQLKVKLVGNPGPECSISLSKRGQLLTSAKVDEHNTCSFFVSPGELYTLQASSARLELKVQAAGAASVSELELQSRCQ